MDDIQSMACRTEAFKHFLNLVSILSSASTIQQTMDGENSAKIGEIKRIWRNCDAVCFDVDSTVCQDEGIDEFAKVFRPNVDTEEFTDLAMSGRMSVRESLLHSFNEIRPTKAEIEKFAQTKEILLTPGVETLISELQKRNAHIYLVSGSLRQWVAPVARRLNIPEQNIIANDLLFNQNDQYAGVNTELPTSDSGSINTGKAAVCRSLKLKYAYKNLVMIGDATTDLEASNTADAFIGFGGNKVRIDVKKKCAWFIYNFKVLHDELLSSMVANE